MILCLRDCLLLPLLWQSAYASIVPGLPKAFPNGVVSVVLSLGALPDIDINPATPGAGPPPPPPLLLAAPFDNALRLQQGSASSKFLSLMHSSA